MKTVKDSFDEIAEDDRVHTLLLTCAEVQATLRALAAAPTDDVHAAAAHRRLTRLLERRAAPAPQPVRANDGGEHLAPPHDLPDTNALAAFQRPSRRARR